ncbi:hypothetical protein B566_EDAN013030 [Ephemera danica]|nr:hypothetical protein B566_EDAN013030 [Ephemera danica]
MFLASRQLSATPGATVRTLIQGISVLREPETEVAASPVAFSAFLNPPKSYINYLGSLTTPLCGESVVWIVSTKTLPVSSEQLASFRTLHFKNGQPMVDNFRPVQPLNGRSMYYYTSLL